MSEKADVKSSRMQKGRKTINYLQKLKDEGDHGGGTGRKRK